MQNSKKEIILKTLEDPDVKKTVEGIMRTEQNSDSRRIMIELFCFKFSEIAAKVFEESIVGELDKRLKVMVNVSLGLEIELLGNPVYIEKIAQILIEKENLEFNIMLDDKKIIIIQQILVEGKETYIIAKFFFSGDSKKDNIILNTFNVLSKR